MLLQHRTTRYFIAGLMLSLASLLGCQASGSKPMENQALKTDPTVSLPNGVDIIAGTYNQQGSEGIYRFHFNPATQQFSPPVLLAKDDNPSFIHVENNLVYVVNELGNGLLSTYQYDDNQLSKVASVETHGASPCYVSMSPDKKWLATANYMGGNVSVFSLSAEGIPQPNPQVLQHSGKGPNKSRQEGPHAHWVQWDKNQSHIYTVDLGIDEINVYPFESSTGKVGKAITALKLSPGDGPRHLFFHPSKALAYILNELSNTITVASVKADGVLQAIQQIDTLPSDFTGHNQGGHIYINNAGDTLYASNRGHDSIAVFAMGNDGRLALKDVESTQGNWPRHFLVIEEMSVLLVANQESNTVVALSIKADGTLSATGAQVSLPQVTFLGRL